ncbi:MAG: cytochrome c oxidase assembly protein, partial [Pseudomonadota bacterium]
MQLEGKRKTLAQTVSVVIFMGALAWAAVPLYDWFCRVTGYGGATNISEGNTDGILDQTILVRFDASLERDMPWEFTPVAREMEIRI